MHKTAVVAILLAVSAATLASAQTPLIVGMDHIPIVVSGLEKAQADFRAMGFAIKPGRPHADGIRNAHVKFRDGTELELITPPEKSVDSLTSEYRSKLMFGEGPVYFGLYAPDRAALEAKLKKVGIQDDSGLLTFPAGNPLHPLFFAQRQKSPTDRPEHFAHANTAFRLSGLWVRERPEYLVLFRKLGVAVKEQAACGPLHGEVNVVHFPEGDLTLVRETGKEVLAARIEVKSLAAAQAILQRSGQVAIDVQACDRPDIWFSTARTHGIWLEFIQAPPD